MAIYKLSFEAAGRDSDLGHNNNSICNRVELKVINSILKMDIFAKVNILKVIVIVC